MTYFIYRTITPLTTHPPPRPTRLLTCTGRKFQGQLTRLLGFFFFFWLLDLIGLEFPYKYPNFKMWVISQKTNFLVKKRKLTQASSTLLPLNIWWMKSKWIIGIWITLLSMHLHVSTWRSNKLEALFLILESLTYLNMPFEPTWNSTCPYF